MIDVINDVSKLSSISEKLLSKLIGLETFSILEGLQEMMVSENQTCDFDIGLGILTINLEDNNIKFKFKPSAKFKEELIKTLKNKQNSLELEIEENFVEKIRVLYKELI